MPMDSVWLGKVTETKDYSTLTDVLMMDINFTNEYKPELMVKKVDGMEPPEVVGNLSEPYGGFYYHNGFTVQQKKLTLRIGIEPNFSAGSTYEALRKRLYEYMYVKANQTCKLMFRYKDKQLYYARGYVRMFETDPFSRDSDILMHYDMIDPYFRTEPLRQTQNAVGSPPSYIFYNNGTAPGTIRIVVKINTNTSQVTMSIDGNSATITHPFGFMAGDQLTIDLDPRYPNIEVLRNGSVVNLLANTTIGNLTQAIRITPPYSWVQFTNGGITYLDGYVTEGYWGY